MRNEYIMNLMKQYAAAQGYKNPDFNSLSFLKEFEQWLLTMRVYGKDYLSFVELLNAKPLMRDFATAEVGKGPLDSVIRDTNYEMITENFSGDMVNNFCVVTPGEFVVIDSQPALIQTDKVKLLNKSGIERFITQNPYTPELLNGWSDMHNSGKQNITVGMFGNISDKDRNTKTKEIKNLVDRLNNDIKFDSYTFNDSYGVIVSSDRTRK